MPFMEVDRMKQACIAVWALLLGFVVVGCATNYELRYEAQLRGQAEPGSLVTEQDGLRFEFLPLPVGVAFEIVNNAAEDAVLDWSRSYFIAPGGNSFKALNTDTLNEVDIVALKSLDIATVPRGAMLRRFTTASVNPERYRILRLRTFSTWMGSYGGGWTFSSLSIDEGLTFPEYYPLSVRADESQLKRKFEEVSKVMAHGPSMGLGLMIRTGANEKLYRFDIEFTKVSALAARMVETEAGQFITRHELTHTSTREDDWTWTDLRPSKSKKSAVVAP